MRFYDFSNVLFQGPANCGKSELAGKIIEYRDQLFFTPISKVIVVYSHWQDLYQRLAETVPGIVFMETLPTESELTSLVENESHSLFVADDKGHEAVSDPFIAHLFSRLSHHKRITPMILLQNAGIKGKFASDIVRNAHYHILLKSPKSSHLVRTLGLRMNDFRNLTAAYKLATDERPYSYLCVNNHPKSEITSRYYSTFLPSDGYISLFLPSNRS